MFANNPHVVNQILALLYESERLPGDALIEFKFRWGLRQCVPVRERFEEVFPGGRANCGEVANAQTTDGLGRYPSGAGLRSAGAVRGDPWR